ncbi:MAG: TRAP transporter small permease [Hydrogenophaga sp.]
MLASIERGLERLALWLAAAGALIIVVQTVWISYGVFMRYVVGKPDGTVTEATALLLFPAALLGLAFALREDAYPKVSFLIDALGPRGQQILTAVNLVLKIQVGILFSISGVDATIRAYGSGTASEILLWPRYLFWAPGALALVVFTVYACVRLASVLSRPPQPAPQQQ